MLVPAALLLVLPTALIDGVTAALAASPARRPLCIALASLASVSGSGCAIMCAACCSRWAVVRSAFRHGSLLLAFSGAPWVQEHAAVGVLPLMLNPLSALRVTMLFSLEQTAPASIGSGALVGWWLRHGGLWLGLMLTAWAALTFVAGVAGARRRLDI